MALPTPGAWWGRLDSAGPSLQPQGSSTWTPQQPSPWQLGAPGDHGGNGLSS